MRLIAVLLTVLITSISGLAAEEFSGEPLLDKVKNSIFRIYAYTKEGSINESSNGSCFVVKQSDEETIIATAGHVFGKNAKTSNTSIHVYFKGQRYITNTFTSFLFTQEIDAALVSFKPGIQGLKALSFNLEDNYGIVNALAFGFPMGYSLKNNDQQMSFSYGKVNRAVGNNISVNEDFEQNNFLIRGTPILIGGLSGGPLLDTDLKIIGLNVSISYRASSFTDGRCLWNLLNPDKKVNIIIDPSFNVFNEPNEYRTPINLETDGILYKDKLITFGTIVEYLSKGAINSYNDFPWIRTDIKIVINKRAYDVFRIQSDVNNTLTKSYYNERARKDKDLFYIYLSKKGFRLFIHLDVVKE